MLLYIESNVLLIGLLLGGFITLMITTITLRASRAPREDYQKIPVQKSHQTYDPGYYKSTNNSRYDNRRAQGSSDAVMGIVFFIGLSWVVVNVVPGNSTRPHNEKQDEPVIASYTHGTAPLSYEPVVDHLTSNPANIQAQTVENTRPQPAFASNTNNPVESNYMANSVQNEQKQAISGIDKSYFIQVGAFSVREMAARAAKKWFKALSTNADVVIADENGNYKVWIGVFDEIKAAKNFKRYAGLPKDALIKKGEGATLSYEF